MGTKNQNQCSQCSSVLIFREKTIQTIFLVALKRISEEKEEKPLFFLVKVSQCIFECSFQFINFIDIYSLILDIHKVGLNQNSFSFEIFSSISFIFYIIKTKLDLRDCFSKNKLFLIPKIKSFQLATCHVCRYYLCKCGSCYQYYFHHHLPRLSLEFPQNPWEKCWLLHDSNSHRIRSLFPNHQNPYNIIRWTNHPC